VAEVITTENADGSVTTTVIEAGRRFSGTTTPQEAARLALALFGASVGFATNCFPRVGASKRVRDYTHAALIAWDTLTPAQQQQHRTPENWWKAIGKDARVSSRASFAAMKAERPDDTAKGARDWWGGLSTKSRQRLRERYSPGYGDDLFDDLQKIVKPVAQVLQQIAPAARAIPGFGPVIAAGIQQGAAAAASISDPKEALAMLAGGPNALKALSLVRGASVSKVLGQAANELAQVAPATSAKLDATSKLNMSSIAAGIGAPSAQKLVTQARQSVTNRLAKAGPPSAAQVASVLAQANNGRKALLRTNAAPVEAASIIERARAGRVRSSRGGPVSPAELAAAAAAGRVFFVS
jgi:hypothetical protein